MINDLFDHEATVHKRTEVLETGTRRPVNTYEAAYATEYCAIVTARFGVRDTGAGRRNEGETTVYLDVAADVVRGDVLEVFDGPNAPLVLEVMSVERPRGNHTEATVKPFTGRLDAVAE